MPRLSVIVPTIGRPSVRRTLASIRMQQLQPGDEVLLVADGRYHDVARWWAESRLPGRLIELADGPHNDWGATARTIGQQQATGDCLLWMDDDDVYTPDAWATIRTALAAAPGRPHMFRMWRTLQGDRLWRTRDARCGNISTQMFVVPNMPERLGAWGRHYCGDADFITSTLARWPSGSLVWREEIICLCRPDGGMTWRAIPGWTDGLEGLYTSIVERAAGGELIVELGSWLGRSVVMLAQLARAAGKDIRICTVDHGLGSPDESEHLDIVARHGGSIAGLLANNLRLHGVQDIVRQIVADSVQASQLFGPLSVDAVIVDAAHSTESVRRDLEAWWPKIKPGGIMAGHDYDWPSVRAAVDGFFDRLGLPVYPVYRHCWQVTTR
jgi:glycosyltransferase involved in cell wall biosynthesis